jgi:hypothetical protein
MEMSGQTLLFYRNDVCVYLSMNGFGEGQGHLCAIVKNQNQNPTNDQDL